MRHVAYAGCGLLVGAIVLCETVRTSLPKQVSSHQEPIYSSIASVGATLLGFLITAIALLAVLPPSNPVVRKLQEQGLLGKAVREIARASAAMALCMAVGLAGLIIDQPPEHPIRNASELGTDAYWIWAVALTILPAGFLLGSSMLIVARAVRWVADSDQTG
jgi:hypothetical protein